MYILNNLNIFNLFTYIKIFWHKFQLTWPNSSRVPAVEKYPKLVLIVQKIITRSQWSKN